MELFSKMYGLLSFGVVNFLVMAPCLLIFYLSKEDLHSHWFLFIYLLYFTALPGAVDMLNDKYQDDFYERSGFNALIGFLVGIACILFGFASSDPWATRALLGAMASWVIFIFKHMKMGN